MSNLLAGWFSTEGFLPHGHCYLWTPKLLWSAVAAEAAVGIAYFVIPIALLHAMRKRRNTQFNAAFALFLITIVACGVTHLLSIWTIWHPDYWLETGAKIFTAIASVASAIFLWPLIPKLAQLPTTLQMREMIRRLEHEIEERKKVEEALHQSQVTLRELAAYQERIREDERKRIAREIHDELGQNLLALRLDVATLHARAGERRPLLKERAAAALEYIDTTMKSIRTIMNNLRPAVLDLGLPAAIEWQVKQFEQRNAVQCEVVMNDKGKPVPDAEATAVFRILQESLNNIGRHARASHVRVKVNIDERRVSMSIKDNGVGMYPGDRRKPRRFGLVGIEERITMLGGDLRIDSTLGEGTTLRISVPIRTQTHAAHPEALSS